MPQNASVLKRVLIIFLSIILAIFLVLLTAPFLFKNQIMNLAKTELNKMLSAKVDFKDLKLSFIRNFPNAYVALDGLEVTGIDDFEDELLVAFDRFSVTVNIMSVIKMDNIEVKSVLLDRPRLNGHILADGRANWDIVKPGEDKGEVIEKQTEKKPEKETSDPFKLKIGLKKFEIRDMGIIFRDDINKMIAEVEALNLTLRGDMAKENVDLDLKLAVDGIDFWMGAVRFANKVSVGFVSEIAADLKNLNFIIKDNKFNLNDIVLKFDGSAGIHKLQTGANDINMDIKFATEKTDFKSLLSLVPAIYMNDFKDVKTTGSLALSGDIKGTYNTKTMPSANLGLSVDNATFKYPDLPKSVEKINIAAKVHYDGKEFDRTTVDVDKFSFQMAGNPFNAALHVKTPESDMQVAADFAGKIDFNSVSDVIPLDDVTLNGLLECDISLAGKMSTLEKQQYEDFQAKGDLKISNFDFESPDFPQGVKIASILLNFTPRRVGLSNFNAAIGSTDIAMNGSLENFIPFIFKNDTVRGTLALRSNTIDLNELMGGEPAEKKEKTQGEQAPLSVIEVPKNIDFAMNVNIGKILFDKLVISNTAGALTVRDGKVMMRDLGMNLLEGSMTLNGEYNTQNMAAPFIDFDMNIRQFDISSALSSVSLLGKILPEPQNYVGKVSATLTINSELSENLSPMLETVASKGRLQTQNLELRNSKLFGAVADLLKNESWRSPSLGNTNIGFKIVDGRLWLEDPFVMNMAQAKLAITGSQGLNMTMDYKLDATMPVSAIGSAATNLLSSIPGGSRVSEFKLGGLIQGAVKNPEIRLSVADMAGTVTEAVKEQVTQKVEEVKTQVNEEVNRQIEHIMSEAQKQADTIRATTKQAADRVRSEANTQANRLISNAANRSAIEKTLAQTAADKLRSEGEANAKKLEQESENQIKAIMDSAQERAEALRR